MQQLNTSHNRISFGGILQPLVESLERNTTRAGRLSGQEVVIYGRNDVQAIIALDSDSNIHLLMNPATTGDPRLLKIDLKGLKITDKEWAVAGRSSQFYLDLSCSTGILPSFRRPFLKFAEDVLFEISQSDVVPTDAVYKTSLRWKKFWSPEITTEVTKEWIRGFFGELLFLNDLLRRFGPGIIDSWTGPLGKDHDFQKSTNLAVEIKTSSDIPFSITCNIRQLDPDLFKKLYIICYRLTASENGITLPELVRSAEHLMREDENQLGKFYQLLRAAGYELQHESVYAEFKFDYSEASVFQVDKDFPKIIEKSFTTPPDHRISNIRYTVQLTGIENLTVDSITKDLKFFGSKNSETSLC